MVAVAGSGYAATVGKAAVAAPGYRRSDPALDPHRSA
jgi:hypothetical protein